MGSVWLSRVTEASLLSRESKQEAPENQKVGRVHTGIRAQRSDYTCSLNSENELFFSFSLLVGGRKYDS